MCPDIIVQCSLIHVTFGNSKMFWSGFFIMTYPPYLRPVISLACGVGNSFVCSFVCFSVLSNLSILTQRKRHSGTVGIIICVRVTVIFFSQFCYFFLYSQHFDLILMVESICYCLLEKKYYSIRAYVYCIEYMSFCFCCLSSVISHTSCFPLQLCS